MKYAYPFAMPRHGNECVEGPIRVGLGLLASDDAEVYLGAALTGECISRHLAQGNPIPLQLSLLGAALGVAWFTHQKK